MLNTLAKERFFKYYLPFSANEEVNYTKRTIIHNSFSENLNILMTFMWTWKWSRNSLHEALNALMHYMRMMTRSSKTDYPDSGHMRHLIYSNAEEFDSMMRFFLDSNKHWIPDFFDRVFVGKIRSAHAFASAATVEEEDHSYLVIVNSGLMVACFFWCECFLIYVERFMKLYGTEQQTLHDEYVDRVVDIFTLWRSQGGIITLSAAQNLYSEYKIKPDIRPYSSASAADRFILAHELAHHFAGDTNRAKIAVEAVNKFRYIVEPRSCAAEQWSDKEYVADGFAILILLGSPDITSHSQVSLINAGMGALVAISTIACLTDNPYKSTDASYPPPNDRFNEAMAFTHGLAIISSMVSKDASSVLPFATMRKHLMDFHDVMNGRRIKRGLIHV